MTEINEQQKKQFVNILRSIADEIEKSGKPVGVVVAWVMETEPAVVAHGSFSIHQRLGTTIQTNAWRSEASRVMRLMDTVEDQIKAAQSPPVIN